LSPGVPTAQDLLNHGKPLVPFSELALQDAHDLLEAEDL
jgi:hypothetical protein